MCGRFSLSTPMQVLIDEFGIDEAPEMSERFNIAPTQPIWAVRDHPHTGERELTVFQWGLIPSWAKDVKIGNRMINARAETVLEKPSYRNPFRRRRCLIPMTGFYEWQNRNGHKQPWFIRMKHQGIFGVAGLWEHWMGEDGSEIESCTLITTQANSLIKPVHHRMPVIIRREDYDVWLERDEKKYKNAAKLLEVFDPDAMELFPVTTHVNNPRNEDEQCIEPLELFE